MVRKGWFPGINRNIVECKVQSALKDNSCSHRINRNIVECKDAELSAQDKANKY